MPTLAQRLTFEEVTAQIVRGERPNLSKAQRKVGYKESTIKRSSNLTKSVGWKELMDTINDNEILARVREIATDKEDKRACLQAADMIFKLKDRYPAGKLKVQEYTEEISRLQE
jgi:UDP-N-acetylenolpyruvoylglucosamine reductase